MNYLNSVVCLYAECSVTSYDSVSISDFSDLLFFIAIFYLLAFWVRRSYTTALGGGFEKSCSLE
jgi:hypothetical protein